MELPLKINVLEEKDKTVIKLVGEIDINTSETFKEVLDSAINSGLNVYLDLENLEYIDSIGIGIIAVNAKKASDSNVTVNIINSRANILKLFEITKIDQLLNIDRGNSNE